MATTPKIVKIGIQLYSDSENLQELKEFDLNNTVASVIEEICETWGLLNPEEYTLRFSEDFQRNYITESNKDEIKNGLLLILDKNPYIVAKNIISNLQLLGNDVKINTLKKLIHLSKYLTFAKEFLELKGLSHVMIIIQAKRFVPQLVLYALSSFITLMDHCIVSWKVLNPEFVNQIVHFVTEKNFYSYPVIVTASLSVLKNCILYYETNNCIQKDFLVTKLIIRLGTSIGNDQKLKEQVISLINVMFVYADMNDRKIIGATLLSKEVRNIICLNMYKPKSLNPKLATELKALQSNCFSLIEHRIIKIDHRCQYSQVLMRELKRIPSRCEDAAPCPADSEATNKLGFTDDQNLLLDLNGENSTGALALDCMVYFARNYMDSYTSIIMGNNCISEKYQCPFGKSSIELISLLSDILTAKQSSLECKFYPVFFSHRHSFEELYCICIIQLNKTWKDMKATSEDSASVLSVVKEQIIQALSTIPLNLDEFRNGMKALTYMEITNIWHQERTIRQRRDSHVRPVVELKDQLKPEIINLIKQHRLRILVNGTRFCRLTAKGMIIKQKYWFIRLSPNHTFLKYGNCNENSKPKLDELESIIPVSNIKSLTSGRNSSNIKDKKNNKFTIKIVTDDKIAHLDFVTQNIRIFDYWIDGINTLIGNNMNSKTHHDDFDILMSMEIRLRLLDTEGVDIPADPPPIPRLPADFDFPPV